MTTTIRQLDEFTEEHTEYFHAYEWDNNTGCGFSFESTPEGTVIRELLSTTSIESLDMCINGFGTFAGDGVQIIDKGVEKQVRIVKRCKCHSGLEEFWLLDCHHICLCMVCNSCIERKKATYNPWVFTGYTEDDIECPIEPEEEIL